MALLRGSKMMLPRKLERDDLTEGEGDGLTQGDVEGDTEGGFAANDVDLSDFILFFG